MDPQTREPFAENIASGLEGLTLLTTAFLYLFSLAVLVPLSILVIRVFGQKSSDYLIPLLVLVFIIAEYLYCWRLVFRVGSARPLLVVGLVSAIIYAGYRVPADFMDRNWPQFDVFRRSLSWLLGGTVVRSILGPLALLAAYGVIQRFRIRKQWFIVVTEFRVWAGVADKFPDKGVAARLGDELMRLWKEIKARDPKRRLEAVSQNVGSNHKRNVAEAGEVALYDAVGFSLPETQVTLQYEGISIEAVHAFIRRLTKREVVITGDLMDHADGLALMARTTDEGPWEVRVEGADSAALDGGLQRLALRIMTTLTEKFQPKAANAFVVLQIKAGELREYDLALQLARLGYMAAPDPHKASRNLATAQNDIGRALAQEENYAGAISEFKKAIELDPLFVQAYENLALAHKSLGQESEAETALEQANKIRKGLSADQQASGISTR